MKRIYSLSLAVFLACFMALLAVQAAENQTSNQVIKLDPELAEMVRSGSISNGGPVTPAGLVIVNIFLTDQRGDAVSSFLNDQDGQSGFVSDLLRATRQALSLVNSTLGIRGTFIDTVA